MGLVYVCVLAGLVLLLFDDLEPVELMLEGLLFLPAEPAAGLAVAVELFES